MEDENIYDKIEKLIKKEYKENSVKITNIDINWGFYYGDLCTYYEIDNINITSRR